MARGRKRTFGEKFIQVPNQTAQAPQSFINDVPNEKPISLGALGLLVNLCVLSR